jgi:two-component system, LytTR family, response regulator
MRALIVDDEPLARTALAIVLAERNDVEATDSATDAIEALDKLRKTPFDVVLLDIRLPELSGIEFVDCLRNLNQPPPAIVFVTAHQEHAVAAFEKHAADYVLKPFSKKRVHEALDVAVRRTVSERAARLMEISPQLNYWFAKPAKIAVKSKGRILFLDPAEVRAVEAQGNYVLLRRDSGSNLLRESISALGERLAPHGFIRIHRSVLVNASCVQEIQPWPTGEYVLRIQGGKEYTVSRTYKDNLKALARFSIGTTALFGE